MDVQQKKTTYQIAAELLTLILVVIANALLLTPILLQGEFKFLWKNILMISLTVWYIRYVLSFHSIEYFSNKWFRIFVFLINFHFLILTVNTIQDIIPLWESQNIFAYMDTLTSDLNLTQRNTLLNYIRNEVLIAGLSTIIVIIFLNIRILISFFAANRIRKKEMLKDLN